MENIKMNNYAKNDGYQRVLAFIDDILADDAGATAEWAVGVLMDESKVRDLTAKAREFIRLARRGDEWEGVSARRRWVQAALVEALEHLATEAETTK